jgi:hypothetical protein
MGQFASSISLDWDQILTLAEADIISPDTAIEGLELIAKGLAPRTILIGLPVSAPTGNDSKLIAALTAALTAAYNESIFLFNATFPLVTLPGSNTCFGVVLNYAPTAGNFQSLTSQLEDCFSHWGIPISLAQPIASQIQPQVMNSMFTPSATYGRAATSVIKIADPIITIDYLFWMAAFGVFNTGPGPDGNPQFAVIYSFTAAIGPLEGTIQ